MTTRGSVTRDRTKMESTVRETGESSSRQIKQEASASASGAKAHAESEVTQGDIQDIMAEQRKLIQQLVEQQASMQARLEVAESRQSKSRQSNVLPVAPLAPSAQSRLFKMRDPAPFCGGPAELERFLGRLKMNFESHGHQFPRGDPDKVQYAIGLFRTWLEHPDESQRKSKAMHPAEWANRLVLNRSTSLYDWDRFEKELRGVYGDRDRQLNAALVAYGEMAQGYHDSDESVRDFESRIRSNWGDAGWHADDDSELGQRMLYDLVWTGLRPGIRARIRPFAGKNGRFDTVEELFEKAYEVEIKPNRERRTQQSAATAEKGSGRGSSGKDQKKRPHRDSLSTAPSQAKPCYGRYRKRIRT
jgi:hypothetical protein